MAIKDAASALWSGDPIIQTYKDAVSAMDGAGQCQTAAGGLATRETAGHAGANTEFIYSIDEETDLGKELPRTIRGVAFKAALEQ